VVECKAKVQNPLTGQQVDPFDLPVEESSERWSEFKLDRVSRDSLSFEQLRLKWHEERGATSSITEMAMCPSYQSIIAMGPPAIPLILRQMEVEGDEPDMWFWALRALTNADPISKDDRGDIVKMAQTWLAWAQ
jgi:hypothetical protein